MSNPRYSCIIERNGTLTGIRTDLEYDQEIEIKNIDDIESLFYLNTKVSLSKDITLGDIFNFVENHKTLKFMIIGYSCCPDIDKLHEKSKKIEEIDRNYETLVVSPNINLSEYKDELNLSIQWNWFIEVPYRFDKRNYYKENNCSDCKNKINHNHTYTASFVNVKELAKMKIILKTDCKSTGYNINNLKINIEPTLLQLLGVIYDNIAFCGG